MCYTRAPTEPPKTTTFVEVDETQLDGKEKRIFSGWMFADSPGLNARGASGVRRVADRLQRSRARRAPRPPPGRRAAGRGREPRRPRTPDLPRRRRVPR